MEVWIDKLVKEVRLLHKNWFLTRFDLMKIKDANEILSPQIWVYRKKLTAPFVVLNWKWRIERTSPIFKLNL